MIKALKVLWDFSRPHTIIGSVLSITTLFLLASKEVGIVWSSSTYWLTLVSALGCNVFIVGVNQIVDVDLDKVNKPFLPIANGRLTMKSAKRICAVALIICLATSAFLSKWLLLIMLIILFIGVIYSVPPIRLKKHHLPAALCIVAVRGIIVNLGIGIWFEYMINGHRLEQSTLVPLTAFVTAFSLAIAWFKDLYDVKGDQKFNVKTFAALYDVKTAYISGNAIVFLSYIFCILYFYQTVPTKILLYGHITLLILYLFNVAFTRIKTQKGIYQFYMRFWVFFFAEYVLFIAYALLAF